MYPVCVCVLCVLSWDPSLEPTSVRSGSVPLCWAVTVERWQVYEMQRDGGGAKGLCESEAASEFFLSKLGTYSVHGIYTHRARAAYVGGRSGELTRCVICMGWKRGCSQNMCEILLWPWVSLSCCCAWRLLTCSLSFGIFLKDKAGGRRRALQTHTAMCQMMQLKMIVQQDWVIFNYSHNQVKTLQPTLICCIAKCTTFSFFFFQFFLSLLESTYSKH